MASARHLRIGCHAVLNEAVHLLFVNLGVDIIDIVAPGVVLIQSALAHLLRAIHGVDYLLLRQSLNVRLDKFLGAFVQVLKDLVLQDRIAVGNIVDPSLH